MHASGDFGGCTVDRIGVTVMGGDDDDAVARLSLLEEEARSRTVDRLH